MNNISLAERQRISRAAEADRPRRDAERARLARQEHESAYSDVTDMLSRLGIDPDRLREWLDLRKV